MSNVTPQMVKELRERTGVGLGKCKEALTEAQGQMEKAIDNLRKAGAASAVKKGARETKEGMIATADTAKGVALVEINAETDFVVRNERFQEFASRLAEIALNENLNSTEALADATFEGGTVEEARVELVQVLGENIQVRRLLVMPKKEKASYGIYSYMGGKIVVAVEVTGESGKEAVARDVAMHAAAEAPDYLDQEEIPQADKDREAEVARSQIQNKPAEIQDKIIEGKLRAFADQICLVRQKFVKDPSKTVADYVKSCGADMKVTWFARWQVGE